MKNYFYISFGLHLILFCCFLTTIQLHNIPLERASPSVPSYLFSDLKVQHSKILFQESKQGNFKNKKAERNLQSSLQNQSKQESQQNKKVDDNMLLKLLHEAIFEKQTYPEEASLMHETGKVTISLVVHPDGEVDQVKLLKSSGYSIIDNAAEKAVADISPLNSVKNFLTRDKGFSIDISFV